MGNYNRIQSIIPLCTIYRISNMYISGKIACLWLDRGIIMNISCSSLCCLCQLFLLTEKTVLWDSPSHHSFFSQSYTYLFCHWFSSDSEAQSFWQHPVAQEQVQNLIHLKYGLSIKLSSTWKNAFVLSI